MTPGELGAALGVSIGTLQRWARRRIGPPRVKAGNRVLYRREAVHGWLLSRETPFERPKGHGGR